MQNTMHSLHNDPAYPGTMPQAPVAWRSLAGVALAVALLLIATSGRYGYHRDELYFVQLGAHPALGYVDQPPLVPLLAAALHGAGEGSLILLRLPSALAAAAIALLTGLTARELGAGRGGQVLAAAAMAGSAFTLAVGHLMSTSTFDLLWWTLLGWLLVRALRDGGAAWWGVGAVTGVALQTKSLVLLLVASVLLALLAVGPRRALASRSLWTGAVLALLIWSPNLWWQISEGLPQLDLAGQVASGSSGTSEPRWLVLPFQLVLISPVLVPVWALGWWRLVRDPDLRVWRPLAVAFVVLLVLVLVLGGKPYYVCGLYPVLLAAGAEPVARSLGSGGARVRTGALVAAAVGLAVNVVLFLPVLPADRLAATPITDVNYDAGETVGWPAFADTVSTAYASVPPQEHPVVLTGNYGEAGAIHHLRPGIPVHSGHNSLWDLGPPPVRTETVVAVGVAEQELDAWFAECTAVASIDNGVDLDNEEQGEQVWRCTGPTMSWDERWPDLRRRG